MSSKTVEEAFDKRARVWVMANSLERGTTWDQARIDAFVAGAAHGAAEKRRECEQIIVNEVTDHPYLRDKILYRIRQQGE